MGRLLARAALVAACLSAQRSKGVKSCLLPHALFFQRLGKANRDCAEVEFPVVSTCRRERSRSGASATDQENVKPRALICIAIACRMSPGVIKPTFSICMASPFK